MLVMMLLRFVVQWILMTLNLKQCVVGVKHVERKMVRIVLKTRIVSLNPVKVENVVTLHIKQVVLHVFIRMLLILLL
jgi:hypothetical protein